MKTTALSAAAFLLLASGTIALADVDGFGPWKFGQSPAEVSAVEKFGPYLPVKTTGGLETFDGQWEGKKTNISFIFKDEELDKIQIWAYEGKEKDKALDAWWRVAAYKKRLYGDLELKQFPDGPLDAEKEEFIDYFSKVLDAGKTPHFQMGLKKMPKGATVFSSFFVHPEHGYYVFLYHRRPPAS